MDAGLFDRLLSADTGIQQGAADDGPYPAHETAGPGVQKIEGRVGEHRTVRARPGEAVADAGRGIVPGPRAFTLPLPPDRPGYGPPPVSHPDPRSACATISHVTIALTIR